MTPSSQNTADASIDWLAAKDPRAGQMVGHYQIERQLGAGGMGVVYLAHDTRLGRPVALKLLRPDLTQDPERVRRFRREARAASALNHPNILTIYEVGQADSTAGDAHFIAAEFVDGQTLRDLCERAGLTLGATLDILIQVAGALSAAHEAGIVHRDIKPENIMLRKDGLVKALDFGLAKLTEQDARPPSDSFARATTQPGAVMGTVSYMSPEQSRGLEVDERSDVFSLGVVMYELLTGRAPFEGETTSDVLVALLSSEPRPLASYVAKLPGALQEISARALAKPVGQRYQTARELGDDLKRLKGELEFAAKLKGHTGSGDDLLRLTVGSATAAADQTTMVTRPAVAPATSRLTVLRGLRRRYGKGLALAALALALALIAAATWRQWLASRRDAIDSVAVLPFTNVGADPQMEYLPDGITENLINSLTQLPSLRRVMSRSVAFTYKGREVDPRQAGQALQVRAVVTGRVQRLGDRLVINVELVDAATGAQLWGERYQRPFADLLTVQEEIAREIAEALRLRLSGDEQRQLAKRYTQNNEAYQLYLEGRYHWNKRTGESMRKSVECYKLAIEKDSDFALAYVGLADSYATLGSYHVMQSRDVLPLARDAAAKALGIDEGLAEAHASMGKILSDYYGDWTQAEREFQRAIDLKPNYPNSHHWYSTLLAQLGRYDEAVSEANRALELDYFSPVTGTQVGNVLYQARRYDQAIAALRRTLGLEPNFAAAHYYLGLCYLMQEKRDEAGAEFEKALAIAPNTPDFIALLGYTSAVAGRRDQALRRLEELNEVAKRRYVPPLNYAAIHVGLGDRDQAFKLLEKCDEECAPWLRGLKTDPLFESLRADSRFAGLMRRAGLAP
ncbi:MAG TPA: protein kinase [Blastocatellia bacterium]|jgi:serine/threonine-protein kinase|nr:protein kinase [Blastocatellia bacterium]